MKLSEAFQYAKEHFRDSRNAGFICITLSDLLSTDKATAVEAITIVQARILGCYTADRFVACFEYGYEGESRGVETFLREHEVDMEQWRLDFLDLLIAEYEAKGQ